MTNYSKPFRLDSISNDTTTLLFQTNSDGAADFHNASFSQKQGNMGTFQKLPRHNTNKKQCSCGRHCLVRLSIGPGRGETWQKPDRGFSLDKLSCQAAPTEYHTKKIV